MEMFDLQNAFLVASSPDRQDRRNYPYFAGEKTEAQRGQETVQVVAADPSRGLWGEWSL